MHALVLSLTLLALPQGPAPKPEGERPPPRRTTYAVIAHAKTPDLPPESARATIRKLFLREAAQWPDGPEARAYAREGNSDEHRAFLRDVLGMSEAELARHWLRLKNTDGTPPPKEVDSERMMLRFVARREGAFGIVRVEAARAEGIKVLLEF
jgi:hypothetical protein